MLPSCVGLLIASDLLRKEPDSKKEARGGSSHRYQRASKGGAARDVVTITDLHWMQFFFHGT